MLVVLLRIKIMFFLFIHVYFLLAVVYFISVHVYLQYATFYKHIRGFLCILDNIQLYKLDNQQIGLTFNIFTFIILIKG